MKNIIAILLTSTLFASTYAIPTVQYETGDEIASGDFGGDFHILETVHLLSSKNLIFDRSTKIVTEYETEENELEKRKSTGISSVNSGNGVIQTRIVDKEFTWTQFQPVTSCYSSGDSDTKQNTPYTINYTYNSSNGVSYASIKSILTPPKGYSLVQNDVQKNTTELDVPANSVGQTWASRAVVNFHAQQRRCNRKGQNCNSWSSNTLGHVAVTGKKKSLTQSKSEIGEDNVQC